MSRAARATGVARRCAPGARAGRARAVQLGGGPQGLTGMQKRLEAAEKARDTAIKTLEQAATRGTASRKPQRQQEASGGSSNQVARSDVIASYCGRETPSSTPTRRRFAGAQARTGERRALRAERARARDPEGV